jgi:hypothetical protein
MPIEVLVGYAILLALFLALVAAMSRDGKKRGSSGRCRKRSRKHYVVPRKVKPIRAGGAMAACRGPTSASRIDSETMGANQALSGAKAAFAIGARTCTCSASAFSDSFHS